MKDKLIKNIEETYYKYSKKGIKLISNKKNNSLKLEKNFILKDVGAFSVYNFKSYLKNDINKVTNIVLDDQDSFMVLNKSDLIIANNNFKKLK